MESGVLAHAVAVPVAAVLSMAPAVFLRAAAHWIAKGQIHFLRAWFVTFLAVLVGVTVFPCLRFAASSSGLPTAELLPFFLCLTAFAVLMAMTVTYGVFVKRPDGKSIGLLKGFVIGVGQIVMLFFLTGIVFGVFFLIWHAP